MRVPILNKYGVVVNVLLADENWQPSEIWLVRGPDGGEIGDTLVDGVYVKPYIEKEEEEGSNIPQSVTPFQAYTQLHRAGLLELVENYMAMTSIEDQIAWEKAVSFERDSPFLIQLSKELGLTEEFVDQLFIDAAKI